MREDEIYLTVKQSNPPTEQITREMSTIFHKMLTNRRCNLMCFLSFDEILKDDKGT